MKLHTRKAPVLQPGKRREFSARTRFLDFPWGSQVGWPLREIGVRVAGIDYLNGHFLGGTAASTTHLLYFVLSGQVECNYGEGYLKLGAGHWACCSAHDPHWILNRRGKAEALWVHLLDTSRWHFLRNQSGIFKIDQPSLLRDSLVQAIQEAGSRDYAAFECATAKTNIFRIYLIREIDRAYQKDKSAVFGKLADLWTKVDSELDQAWTVERLASQLHVSVSSLFQLVAKHHGLSPMQMVTRLRMERAKDLLLHSEDKLEKIAAAIGYETAFSFSDAFVRETGVRPGKFRREDQSALAR